MADPRQAGAPDASAVPEGADREGTIEQLLLAGLDHYFAGRYEQAIHVWTRVLFLDRGHARARAYIERARSALAEQQRRSEELLHRALSALARGDLAAARALAEALIERGGLDDEAAALLARIAQLERPSPGSSPLAPRTGAPAAPPPPAARPDRPRVRWGPLVALGGLLTAAGVYALLAWDDRVPRIGPRPVSEAAAPTAPAALPWPSLGELALARARALYARGRLRDALHALEVVGPGDPERPAADELRATIQRLLLAGSASAPPPPAPPQGPP
jgi:hypothetical protein